MECILPEPVRSLSEVAKEAKTTLSFTRQLPNVKPVVDKVLTFLEGLGNAERPQVLLVVGDWGEGKTALYEGLIEPWCHSHGCNAARVTAIHVFECFEKARGMGLEPSDALVYALACSLLGDTGLPRDPESVVSTAFKPREGREEAPLLVYIDEFEDIVAKFDVERERVIEVLQGLLHFMNAESRLLRAYGLEQRLHLGIAVSRAAYQVLHSRGETSSIWPRIARRAYTVELQRLTQLEAAYLLDRLISYVFASKADARSIAEYASLLNPIIAASMGLPGALERAVNTLVNALREGCEKSAKRLTLENAVNIMDIIEVNVEGLNEKVLISEEYRLLEDKCASILAGSPKEDAVRACRLLLLSGHGVREEELEALVKGSTTLLARRGFALRARVYRIPVDPPRFIDAFVRIVNEVQEEDATIEMLVRELGGPLRVYRELFDSYAGFCADGSYCITLPAYPEEELRERLGSSDYEQLLEVIVERLVSQGLLEDAGRGVIVPFKLYSRYVFTHEIMLLEFVERRYRLRVWREARRLEPRSILPGLAAIVAHRLALHMGMSSASITVRDASDEHVLLVIRGGREESTIRILGVDVRVPREASVVIAAYSPALPEKLERLGGEHHLVVVYSVGAPGDSARILREIERRVNTPTIMVSLTRSSALRLAALGVWGYNKGFSPAELTEALYSVLVDPSSSKLPEGPRIHQLLTKISDEHHLDHLAESAVQLMREKGVLLPEALRDAEGNVRKPDDLVEAARWLSLYPERLDIEADIGDIYRMVDDDVRRHMKIGAKRALLSADIESAAQLGEYISSLKALKLVEYDTATRRVRLTPRLSPYVERLYSLLSGGPAPLEHVARYFIDASGGYALQALIESLVELGLLDYQKSRVIILSLPDARRKIAEARNRLDRITHSEGRLIDELGYLVFAKKRGYRVSLTREVIDSIRARLELADELTDSFEAMRLAAAAWKIGEQILGFEGRYREAEPGGCNKYSRHLQLLVAAEKGVRQLIRWIEEKVSRLRRELEGLEKLVHEYIADGVVLECSLLSEAERRLREAKKFIEARLTRSLVEAEVKKLWESMRSEEFPFYYRSENTYCNNYKWWYIAERLELERLREELNTLATSLESLKMTLSRSVEDARRNLETLRGYKARLESRGGLARAVARLIPVPEQLPRLQLKAVYDIAREHDRSRFYTEVLGTWKQLTEARALQEKITRLEDLLSELDMLRERVKALRKKLDETVSGAEALLEAVGAEGEVGERLASILDGGSSIAGILDKMEYDLEPSIEAKNLEQALQTLTSIVQNQRDMLAKLEDNVAKLEESLRECIEALRKELEKRIRSYEVVEAVARQVEARGEVASVLARLEEARRLVAKRNAESISQAWRILGELPEADELLELLAREHGLETIEVRVLAAVAKGLKTLSELEKEIGPVVWDTLQRLYRRGLIDVIVEPRHPESPR